MLSDRELDKGWHMGKNLIALALCVAVGVVLSGIVPPWAIGIGAVLLASMGSVLAFFSGVAGQDPQDCSSCGVASVAEGDLAEAERDLAECRAGLSAEKDMREKAVHEASGLRAELADTEEILDGEIEAREKAEQELMEEQSASDKAMEDEVKLKTMLLEDDIENLKMECDELRELLRAKGVDDGQA